MKMWITALALTATAGLAAAQDAPRGGYGGGMLRRADSNDDGIVTRAEYQAATEQRFARMDANGDGILGPDERPARGPGANGAAPPPPGTGSPATGPVARAQYLALATTRFDRLDTDHDGKLSPAEIEAATAAMRAGLPPAPRN